MSAKADPAEIRRALTLLCGPGDVHELRVLHADRAGTVSGYYADPDALARDAAGWSGRAPGVYLTLSPVQPSLLARARNRAVERARHTTADMDIMRRRWVMVDFDPKRPAGVSATDAEHEAALSRADAGRQYLRDAGCPADSMVLADSGNGAHVLVRVDEPADTETRDLVRQVLAVLDTELSDEAVQVDVSTYNAARICKLYGTIAAKGDATPDRPHRIARLLDVPATITPCPRDVLTGIAARHVPATRTAPSTSTAAGGTTSLDLLRWLGDHGLTVARAKPTEDGGTLYELDGCPMDVTHERDRAAYATQHASGAISAGCHHDRCQGWGWRELRARYEPARARQRHSPARAQRDTDDEAQPLMIIERRPLAESQRNTLDAVIGHFLFRKILTIWSSQGGVGKTTLVLQLIIQAALGHLIFGCGDLIPYGRRWLYVNAEDQLQAIDHWLAKILPEFGLEECPFDIFPVCETPSGEFPLDETNTRRLSKLVNEKGYDGVVIDTGIAVIPDSVNNFISPIEIRRFLRQSLGRLQRETNAGYLMLVHDNRQGQAVSGTADWLNFGRLVLHLEAGERADGQVELTMSHVKDNIGFPFNKLTLTRDLRTLCSIVSEAEKWGDESGAVTKPDDVKQLLARLVRTSVMVLSSEDRTKEATIARLLDLSRAQGVKRAQVRDFAATELRYEARKIGRTMARVVVGLQSDRLEHGEANE